MSAMPEAMFVSMMEGSQPQLLAYCRSLTHDPSRAEDLAQETCLRTWLAFREKRVRTGYQVEQFIGYFLTVAYRIWIDDARSDAARWSRERDFTSQRTTRRRTPAWLREYITDLSDRECQVLELRYGNGGMTFQEIAKRLSCSSTTVQRDLRTAERYLKYRLSSEVADDV